MHPLPQESTVEKTERINADKAEEATDGGMKERPSVLHHIPSLPTANHAASSEPSVSSTPAGKSSIALSGNRHHHRHQAPRLTPQNSSQVEAAGCNGSAIDESVVGSYLEDDKMTTIEREAGGERSGLDTGRASPDCSDHPSHQDIA